jgi:hypothetical protein
MGGTDPVGVASLGLQGERIPQSPSVGAHCIHPQPLGVAFVFCVGVKKMRHLHTALCLQHAQKWFCSQCATQVPG